MADAGRHRAQAQLEGFIAYAERENVGACVVPVAVLRESLAALAATEAQWPGERSGQDYYDTLIVERGAAAAAVLIADDARKLRAALAAAEAEHQSDLDTIAALHRRHQTELAQVRRVYARTVPWLLKTLDFWPGTGWDELAREALIEIIGQMREEVGRG